MMVDKADGYFSAVFTGALALAVVGVGAYSYLQPKIEETVEETVADYLATEITKAGGSFSDLRYDSDTNTVFVDGLAFGEEGMPEALSVQTLELRGASAQAFQRVSRRDNGDPLNLFEELGLTGVTFTDADAQTTIKIEDLTLAEVIVFDPVALDEEPSEDGSPVSVEIDADEEAFHAIIEALHRSKFERFTATGISITDTSSEGGEIKLSEISIEDFNRGDVGPASLSGLFAKLEEDSFEIGQADYAYVKAQEMLTRLYQDMQDGEIELTAPFAGIQTGEMQLTDAALTTEAGRILVDRLAVEDIEYEGALATKSKVSMEGLHWPATGLDEDLSAIVTELGYEELEFSVRMEHTLDVEADTLELKVLEITGADMAAIQLEAAFGGVGFYEDLAKSMTEGDGAVDPATIVEGSMSMSLLSAKLSVVDKSLTGRFIDSMVVEGETSREQVIDVLVQEQLASLSELFGADSAFASDFSEATTAFLNDPGTLIVSANPENPVPFALLPILTQAPGTVAEALGLSAEALPPTGASD